MAKTQAAKGKKKQVVRTTVKPGNSAPVSSRSSSSDDASYAVYEDSYD
jgi:hypothetical protein